MPRSGLTFTFEKRGQSEIGIGSATSTLMPVLSASTGRWQLTMSTGLRLVDDGSDRIDLAISLVGTGPEVSVAASLLEIDAIAEGVGAGASVNAQQQTGLDLVEVIAMATTASAPHSGLVDSGAVGCLLSLPLRSEAPWPRLAAAPATQDDVLATFGSAVPPHVLLIGGSGQGKTTTALNAVVASARAGRTPVILDPHGDLARRAAAQFEEEGIDFAAIDFGASDPLPWNVTEPPHGIDGETWATDLTATIRDLWPDLGSEYLGPVWNRVTRSLLSILIRDPEGPHPLTAFPQLMSIESDLRLQALERIGDQDLSRIVRDEVEPMIRQRDPGNTVTWVTSKLDPMIGDPTVRTIIGRRQSDINFGLCLEAMPLIISVPTTRLTDSGARLLAGVALSHLWMLAQRKVPLSPIDLFIDEWHRIPSPALPQILAEGRKFGINLRLSNQNASQISRPVWDTALANTGGIISFRTGPSDAAQLDALYPTIPAGALTRLPRHWVAVTTGDTDFTAPAPGPMGEDDAGAALERGHRRAAETSRRVCTQLQIDLTHEPNPPSVRSKSSRTSDGFLDQWLTDRKAASARPT